MASVTASIDTVNRLFRMVFLSSVSQT